MGYIIVTILAVILFCEFPIIITIGAIIGIIIYLNTGKRRATIEEDEDYVEVAGQKVPLYKTYEDMQREGVEKHVNEDALKNDPILKQQQEELREHVKKQQKISDIEMITGVDIEQTVSKTTHMGPIVSDPLTKEPIIAFSDEKTEQNTQKDLKIDENDLNNANYGMDTYYDSFWSNCKEMDVNKDRPE